jgi:DNA-binding beta-propeller fold protein YncE
VPVARLLHDRRQEDMPAGFLGMIGKAIKRRRMAGLLGLLAGVAACWPIGCRPTSGQPPEGLKAFGGTGLGPGEFSYPRAAAIDRTGRIFVVDKAARIQRFSATGTFECAWRTPEYQQGKPVGLGIGPQDRLWVADTHYHRVLVYSADGELLETIGREGTGPGEFLLPTDVAVTHEGSFFVSEYGGNDRISRFNADRQFEISFGAGPPMKTPLNRPNALALDADGTLWTADACNHRIVRFDRGGNVLTTFGSLGRAPGQLCYPYGIDVLPDGNLVVCEYGNNRVQVFDRTGRSVRIWGQPGRAVGQLAYPWSVAVAPMGWVLVVDSGNNRVQFARL